MKLTEKVALAIMKKVTPQQKVIKFDQAEYYFILSSGRTATKFFGSHFNHPPQITATHEPKPKYRLRLWSYAKVRGDASSEQLKKVLYSAKKKPIKQISSKKYLESNPFIFGFATVIKDIFNNPTIIHIVRDPRDQVQSSINNGSARGLKKLLRMYLPYWHVGSSSKYTGHKYMLELQVAEYWSMSNNEIQKCVNQPRYHLFKFEDLFDPKTKAVKKIEKIVGVNLPQKTYKKVNQSKLHSLDSWQNWPPELCYHVDQICGAQMKKFGYGDEPEWKSLVKKGKLNI